MAASKTPPANSSAIFRRVRHIEIRTRRLVTDSLVGAYHSVFKGQGMDFEEVREYFSGDDVRRIDWNVTAKMDKPYVKKFREERELTLMLLVDGSASGAFGSANVSKRELAAEIASVLAYSATRNNDKVGLGLFTDRMEKFVHPQKGRQHVLRVVRDILCFVPEHRGTNLVDALNYTNRVLRRRSIVVLVSDFLQGPEGLLPNPTSPRSQELLRALSLTNRRHDLICVALSDPREQELPAVGLLTIEDAETGQVLEINTNHALTRAQYGKENRRRIELFHRGLRQTGAGVLPLSTSESYILPLRKFFQQRSRKH
ncbi:MAG TPA: DUF58 domain-containing protein [Opitutales bacterium]|jgi:uncharacterized protein (DUF58 family)|nr:DUF58 domain-containing protein [Opitutales bacterium]